MMNLQVIEITSKVSIPNRKVRNEQVEAGVFNLEFQSLIGRFVISAATAEKAITSVSIPNRKVRNGV